MQIGCLCLYIDLSSFLKHYLNIMLVIEAFLFDSYRTGSFFVFQSISLSLVVLVFKSVMFSDSISLFTIFPWTSAFFPLHHKKIEGYKNNHDVDVGECMVVSPCSQTISFVLKTGITKVMEKSIKMMDFRNIIKISSVLFWLFNLTTLPGGNYRPVCIKIYQEYHDRIWRFHNVMNTKNIQK